MPATASYQEFYNNVRYAARDLVSSFTQLESLRAVWNANGYGDTTPNGTGLPPGVGANLGLTAADVGPALFATVDAINGLDPSFLANLRKLI